MATPCVPRVAELCNDIYQMDPALAFLESTREFDTVSLARSTQRALEIIIPWCKVTDSNSLIPVAISKEIEKQAHVYARAIDFSVEAAFQGFTVAEDALSLVELIKDTTPEDRVEFLKGMQEFAQKGRDKAMEAHKRFVSVRTDIEKILVGMKAESEAGVDNARSRDLQQQLARGANDLDEFSKVLSKFVAWWNEMEMESRTQLIRGNMVVQRFDAMRMKAIGLKWRDHRTRYAAYVDEIGIVQDRHPSIFADARAETFPEPTQKSGPPPPYIDTKFDRVDMPKDLVESPSSMHDAREQDASTVIISEDLSPSSYLSASLSTVQILEKRKCLIIIKFQCHPSQTRRFTSLRIKWKLVNKGGRHSPKVVDIAPKQSIGARNDEHHKRTFGLTVPAQFSMAGAVVGPEVNHEWGMEKIVSRAMTITGTARGRSSDSAEWSVIENSSAMSGVPPHFCVALVAEYHGPFQVELDVVAKQLGTVRWWSSRNHARGDCLVDPDVLHHKFEEHKPSRDWRTWFPHFNGEVEGGKAEYAQEALRRG